MKPYSASTMVQAGRSVFFAVLVWYVLISGTEAFGQAAHASAKHSIPPAVTQSQHGLNHVGPHNDSLTLKAQTHFYNMEYDASIRDYEQVRQAHPDDPFAYNYLAAAIVFKELWRVGALDAESYAKETFLDSKVKRPLDPEVKKRAMALIDRSEQLCNERLKANPNDVDALYARGVARGLRSTYNGVAEKAWLAAIRSALAARHDHERVLELDPNYVDAKMVVGMHNYIIGSLNWAYRMAVALAGVSGNKTKGMAYLRDVAYGNSLANMDAKIALALFLRHQQKYDECLKIVKMMIDKYPKNFLAQLEYANTLNAAGHGAEAVADYEKILADMKAGKYPVQQPELVAYALGGAARGQHRWDLAAQSFDEVQTFRDIDPELVRKAILCAGEMWDMQGRRDVAIAHYKRVIEIGASTPEAQTAKKRTKSPYRHVDKKEN